MLCINKNYLDSCSKEIKGDSYDLLSYCLYKVVKDATKIELDMEEINNYLHYLNTDCDVDMENVLFGDLLKEKIPNDKSDDYRDIREKINKANSEVQICNSLQTEVKCY